jgi:2-polyprenyl-3-methyl-5-hydroxy-6-metoxy-1,4-benzoquinol methylase
MVLSPITNKEAEFVKSIPVSLILEQHREEFGIDVSTYFKGLNEIAVYRCRQTGYRFYYPLGLDADDKFYEYLQKYPWYYADWKWDYETALPFVAPGSKVLDIGCGYGNFLIQLVKQKNCDCTGLEFNDKAVASGRAKGLNIVKQFVQEHVKTNKEAYDYVCFFQVLEHIADIKSFMEAAIGCVKPGGKLIVCVPNNNPYFLRFFEYHSLNMPPHHMGMWDEASLTKLADVYSLEVENVISEPLSRLRFYTKLFIRHKAGNSKIARAMLTLATPALLSYFLLTRKRIKAGVIMAVYKKK